MSDIIDVHIAVKIGDGNVKSVKMALHKDYLGALHSSASISKGVRVFDEYGRAITFAPGSIIMVSENSLDVEALTS